MTLQNIFYIVAIIFMVFYMLLTLAIIIWLFYFQKKIIQTAKNIETRIIEAKNIITNPEKIIAMLSTMIFNASLHQVKKLIKSKKK